MRTFADAFAEPRETGREFKAEVGDESALLQLCITSDGDELKWEFRTAALAWSDSVQVVRDTFIQPLVEVKQIVDLYEAPRDRRKSLKGLKSRLGEQREILLEQCRELEQMLRLMDETLEEVSGELSAVEDGGSRPGGR